VSLAAGLLPVLVWGLLGNAAIERFLSVSLEPLVSLLGARARHADRAARDRGCGGTRAASTSVASPRAGCGDRTSCKFLIRRLDAGVEKLRRISDSYKRYGLHKTYERGITYPEITPDYIPLRCVAA
jgi:hypothetical protein